MILARRKDFTNGDGVHDVAMYIPVGLGFWARGTEC